MNFMRIHECHGRRVYKTFSKAPSDSSGLKVTIENKKILLKFKANLNISHNTEVQTEPLTWTTILYILTWK